MAVFRPHVWPERSARIRLSCRRRVFLLHVRCRMPARGVRNTCEGLFLIDLFGIRWSGIQLDFEAVRLKDRAEWRHGCRAPDVWRRRACDVTPPDGPIAASSLTGAARAARGCCRTCGISWLPPVSAMAACAALRARQNGCRPTACRPEAYHPDASRPALFAPQPDTPCSTTRATRDPPEFPVPPPGKRLRMRRPARHPVRSPPPPHPAPRRPPH